MFELSLTKSSYFFILVFIVHFLILPVVSYVSLFEMLNLNISLQSYTRNMTIQNHQHMWPMAQILKLIHEDDILFSHIFI